MVRLIDADSIRYTSKGCGHPYCQQVCENIDGNGTLCKYLMTNKSEIDSLPTVDAVPIVQCKDCKYLVDCKLNGIGLPRHDWFCADGERKDGDSDEID